MRSSRKSCPGRVRSGIEHRKVIEAGRSDNDVVSCKKVVHGC